MQEENDDFTSAFTFGETRIGLPSFFQKNLIDIENQHQLFKRESSARTFSSGCQDNFAIFAFLAFLLTVLDLILELNAARRKRSTINESMTDKIDQRYYNASAAAFSLYRGFLNSQSTTDSQCSAQFMCEGSALASMKGGIGKQIAYFSGWKLKTFPEPISFLHKATLKGIESKETCEKLFPDCQEIPENYRYPGIKNYKEENRDDIRLIFDSINPIYNEWLDNSTLHYT